MKNTITIAKKELFAYFNNPTAYVVIATFLLLWEFLFFRNVFLVGAASLRGLFEFLPWIALVVVPALTMGTLAEEKNNGTLEFLLTRPLNRFELIAGKYLGALLFFALALLFVFPLAWSLGNFGNLDWGEVFSQYLAGVFMVSVLASLGVMVSSFFSSQISAFLVSTVGGFFLIIFGTELISSRLPLSVAPLLEQLSLADHFQSMSRGVLDARDIWYFVSMTAVFLSFSYLNLIKNKYGNRKKVSNDYQVALILLVGIVVLSNAIGTKIPGRIDLTEEKIYTLSSATKKIASDLPDIVNISLYSSDKLPLQLQPVLRETKDILEDYRTASRGKIRVAYKNPSSDPEVAKEAASLGVSPVRFNVVSQEEFQMKEGYLGLVVSYGGKNEAIPFVQNINNLEYELTSFIRKLTVENKPKIGFVSGHGEKSLSVDYRFLNSELEKQFKIEDIAAKGEEADEKISSPASSEKDSTGTSGKISIPEDIETIIIAGPTQDFSEEEKKTLDEFFARGGSALFLVDNVTVSPQTLSASVNEKGLGDYLKDNFGVEVKKDLVYDLQSNETVGFGGGGMQYYLPYPFWIRAQKSSQTSQIASKLENIVLPWPSTLEINEEIAKEKGFEKTELFSTTDNAGVETSDFDVAPDKKFSKQGLAKKTLAVALSSEEKKGNKSRLVAVGDSDFLSDQFARQNSSNFSFALEAISWLSQETALSQIEVKNISERKMSFKSASEQSLVKFGNLALVLLTTAGYGAFRLGRRKKMKEETYHPR